jgi:hypothetical protein
MGPDFALLRSDPAVDASPLAAAASQRYVPLRIVDVSLRDGEPRYDRKLILSRPDQHVAWRGDLPPSDPAALIDLIRGAGLNQARSAA